MKVYVLKDLDDSNDVSVIIAETSTKEAVQEAIDQVKQNELWDWEDIVKALPSDCKVYARWDKNLEEVWY